LSDAEITNADADTPGAITKDDEGTTTSLEGPGTVAASTAGCELETVTFFFVFFEYGLLIVVDDMMDEIYEVSCWLGSHHGGEV
jgi:hypothetical protein